MPLNSLSSKGTELQLGDGASPEVFTKIAGITDMPAVNAVKSTIEDTSLDDVNRHYIHGIGEPPSFTLTLNFDTDDATQAELITAYENETNNNYRVVLPDSPATEYEFKAIILGYSTPYGGINSLLQMDVTFQLNENDNGEIITKDPV